LHQLNDVMTDWEKFVEIMKDASRPSEELYKKMVDE
jgi:hypothetical protein